MRGHTFIERTNAVFDSVIEPDPARDLEIAKSMLASMRAHEQDLSLEFQHLCRELVDLREEILAAEEGIRDAEARL